MRQDLSYLYRIASQFINELDVPSWTHQLDSMSAEEYGKNFWKPVADKLKKWKPETLGKIAALGRGYGVEDPFEDKTAKSGTRRRTSLYEVHCGSWLEPSNSGYNLLVRIATTTVIAAMKDVIDARLRKQDESDGVKAFDQMPDREMHRQGLC
jgi:hypothetical protein